MSTPFKAAQEPDSPRMNDELPPQEQAALAERIDAALPQTQCTRCGYPDCAGYARAIAAGETGINRCPPGGDAGVQRLAKLTGIPWQPLAQDVQAEGPRRLAVIDENWCIGCTKCIQACPVDCIMGAPKQMHTVIESSCTGCELCVPVCPVDCIDLVPTASTEPVPTGWAAWSAAQADAARKHYAYHVFRLERERHETRERLASQLEYKAAHLESVSRVADPEALAKKRAIIADVLAKARARQTKPH